MAKDIYKIIVYWRWDEGECYADMFWCVRWPVVEHIDELRAADIDLATHILQHGTDEGMDCSDFGVLTRAGYPEAAQMLKDLGRGAELRARFNNLKREIISSEVPLTREQVEAIGPDSQRRKTTVRRNHY